ncbi:MAG: 4Fe-4S binding protein [Coriobacteriales bacterium]|jgi:NAD-dependent dihydropyrimidine dehydrogenase PreA subunit|nr:4Fe-4S binding protein [Coriobacteriales bacterium]
MSHPIINTDECSACGICVDACPQGVLDIVGNAASVVNEDACIACGDCMEECPMGAIEEIDED